MRLFISILLLLSLTNSFAQEDPNVEFDIVTYENGEVVRNQNDSRGFKLDLDGMMRVLLGRELTSDERQLMNENRDNWLLFFLKWMHKELYATMEREIDRTIKDPYTLNRRTQTRLKNSARKFNEKMTALFANPTLLHSMRYHFERGNLPNAMTPRLSLSEQGNNRMSHTFESNASSLLDPQDWVDYAIYTLSKAKWFPKTREEYEKVKGLIIKYGMYPAAIIGVPAYMIVGDGKVSGNIPLFYMKKGWFGARLCYSVSDVGVEFKPKLKGCARVTFLRFRVTGTYKENFRASGDAERRVFEGEISENWIAYLMRKTGAGINLFAKTKYVHAYGSSLRNSEVFANFGMKIFGSNMKPGGPVPKNRTSFSGAFSYSTEKKLNALVNFSRIGPSTFLGISLGSTYDLNEKTFQAQSSLSYRLRDILDKKGLEFGLTLNATLNQAGNTFSGSLDLKDRKRNLSAMLKASYVQQKDPVTGELNDGTGSLGFFMQGNLENTWQYDKDEFARTRQNIKELIAKLQFTIEESETVLAKIYSGKKEKKLLSQLRQHDYYFQQDMETLLESIDRYNKLAQDFKYEDPDYVAALGLTIEELIAIESLLSMEFNIDFQFLKKWMKT